MSSVVQRAEVAVETGHDRSLAQSDQLSNVRVTTGLRAKDLRSTGAGEIIVYHRNGLCTRYQAPEETEQARGKALLQAEAESLSSETIAIGKGTFTMEKSLVTKAHQIISGAGIDVTELKWAPLTLQPSTPKGVQLVGNNYAAQADGVTVRRLTIDCNAQNHANGVGVIAVALNGSDTLIEDVKVINPGTKNANECFPVFIYSGESKVVKTNARIRRVEVTQAAPILFRSGLSCIGIAGVFYDSSIEDCYVHDIDVGDSSGTVPGKPRYVHAFGMSGSSDGAPACKRGRVAHNRAINLTGVAGAQGAAIYNDTGSVDGYDIQDNELVNVLRGIHLHEATSYDNVRIFRNKVRFLAEIASTGGIMLSARKAGKCLVADNDVGPQNAYAATGSCAIAIGRVKSVIVRNNILRMKNRGGEIYVAPTNNDVLATNNRRADGSSVAVSRAYSPR